MLNIYNLCGDKIKIAGAASTGYGEELIKKAGTPNFEDAFVKIATGGEL